MIDDKVVFLTLGSSTYNSQSTDMEYVGIEFELSNFALIVYSTDWKAGRSLALSICNKTGLTNRSMLYCESNSNQTVECLSGILFRGSYRCYCKRGETDAPENRNNYLVQGHIF